MKTDPVFLAIMTMAAVAGLFCTFEIGYRVGLRKGHAAEPKPMTTNIVDNGLGAWLAETNHHFGPWVAKSLYVMQLPDGKFYIRFKDASKTNAEFETFFENDHPYETADAARRKFSLNADLQVRKALSDSLENAFK